MVLRLLLFILGLGLMIGMGAGDPAAQSPPDRVYFNPAMPGPDSALYWLDQGGLFATYGNYPAAVRAYTKALELDPNNSEGHFALGLSLAEMGRLDEGLERIEKALSLAPDKADYYYGRGRILLLSGRTEKALADFSKAADMGQADALVFMERSERADI